MPTKYRRLAKELSLTEDPKEIIKLTAQLVMDVEERVKQTSGLEGVYPEIEVRWHLSGKQDELFQELDLGPFNEGFVKIRHNTPQWKHWYRTTVFR